MIRKSGIRFSEKIMLKQKARAGCRSNHNSSRSSVLSEIAYAKAGSQPKLRAASLKTAIGPISV